MVLVISRNTSLQTPSNVLLACQSFSDFLVGLLVQPSYGAFRLIENTNHFVPCGLGILYSESFWICYGVSFLTLSAISFERYTALRLHLRYKEVVTSERVLKVVVGIWLLDIFLTALEWITQTKHLRNVHAGVLLFCLLLTLATHAKIFLIFRRHVCRRDPLKTTIQPQSRLAVNVAYIVAIYVICNIPVLVVMAYLFAGGRFSTFDVFSWSETIAFLNSLINPTHCCWRNREIRRAILGLFSNVNCLFEKVSLHAGGFM